MFSRAAGSRSRADQPMTELNNSFTSGRVWLSPEVDDLVAAAPLHSRADAADDVVNEGVVVPGRSVAAHRSPLAGANYPSKLVDRQGWARQGWQPCAA